MLVRVQRGSGGGAHGLSGAEDKLVDMLQSWGPGRFHLPGLALVNVNVPDKTATRQVDALVFTPSGLIVVEVKGFTRPQAGALTVPPNGPWLVDGEPAAIHTLAGVNPGEQVKAGVYAAKRAFSAIDGGGDAFVTGLVVLVSRGRGLRLGDTSRAGVGIRVALATNKEVRRVMHRHLERRPCWSADGVLDACRVLSLSAMAPTRAELLEEGFPDLILAPARPPQPPAGTSSRGATRVRKPAPAPTSTRPQQRTNNTRGRAPRPPLSGASGPPTPVAPAPSPRPEPPPRVRPVVPPPRAPARRHRRRVPWGLIIALVLLCTISTTAVIIVGQAFQGR